MGNSRRKFLKDVAACAAGMAVGGCVGTGSGANARVLPPRMMWAYLAQLGMKMWEMR